MFVIVYDRDEYCEAGYRGLSSTAKWLYASKTGESGNVDGCMFDCVNVYLNNLIQCYSFCIIKSVVDCVRFNVDLDAVFVFL